MVPSTAPPTAQINVSGRRSEEYCPKSSCSRKAPAHPKSERLIVPEPSSGADWHQKGRRSPSFLPAQESHCYPCFHMLITALPCVGMGVGVGSKPSESSPALSQRGTPAALPTSFRTPIPRQEEGRGTEGWRDPAGQFLCIPWLQEDAPSTHAAQAKRSLPGWAWPPWTTSSALHLCFYAKGMGWNPGTSRHNRTGAVPGRGRRSTE